MKQGRTVHSIAVQNGVYDYYVNRAVLELGIKLKTTKGDGKGAYLKRLITAQDAKRIKGKLKTYKAPKVYA